ncbi:MULTISPECIES: hypothetical protein [Pseudomonas]|uniref:Nucleotide exchange factor GrpE n=1 Tax=Pseudomonas cucumis TaxID=2954082 RepID=A0ABY9F2G5_9PSED|nr:MULTISPECIES: hypothetical protein [Pseudomonas]MDR8363290.1 hypothetical protein [Pseudomonas sp. JL3]URM26823.1 hypothetical protein LLY42_23500 [Pseudomonas frederiksbergensis]WLG87110.1 hypothetical protein PSH97_11565 [Pseudomonas cucumis]WLG92798.1 hypothetical protein PSH72_12240 [Pseudomonas cucumis]
MNNDDVNDDESETTSNVPPADTAGKPDDVVESELEDRDSDAESLDEAQNQEQEAEELRRKIAEIERKVADGN